MAKRLFDVNVSVIVVLVGVALLTSVISAGLSLDGFNQRWLSEWLQNFSTEMFGAVLTFVFLELIVVGRQRREEQTRHEEQRRHDAERERRQLQENAIVELRQALRPDTRQPILDKMRRLVLLQGAFLENADLEAANLYRVDLEGAYLYRVNLRSANLMQANLQAVDLRFADLQGAILQEANLKEARLAGANLLGVNLQNAVFDHETILPDGGKWTPNADLLRFTHPDHIDFWRPDWSG